MATLFTSSKWRARCLLVRRMEHLQGAEPDQREAEPEAKHVALDDRRRLLCKLPALCLNPAVGPDYGDL